MAVVIISSLARLHGTTVIVHTASTQGFTKRTVLTVRIARATLNQMHQKQSLRKLQITVPNASIGSKDPVLVIADPRFLAILCYRIVALLLSSYNTQHIIVILLYSLRLISTTSQLYHFTASPTTSLSTARYSVRNSSRRRSIHFNPSCPHKSTMIRFTTRSATSAQDFPFEASSMESGGVCNL